MPKASRLNIIENPEQRERIRRTLKLAQLRIHGRTPKRRLAKKVWQEPDGLIGDGLCWFEQTDTDIGFEVRK